MAKFATRRIKREEINERFWNRLSQHEHKHVVTGWLKQTPDNLPRMEVWVDDVGRHRRGVLIKCSTPTRDYVVFSLWTRNIRTDRVKMWKRTLRRLLHRAGILTSTRPVTFDYVYKKIWDCALRDILQARGILQDCFVHSTRAIYEYANSRESKDVQLERATDKHVQDLVKSGKIIHQPYDNLMQFPWFVYYGCTKTAEKEITIVTTLSADCIIFKKPKSDSLSVRDLKNCKSALRKFAQSMKRRKFTMIFSVEADVPNPFISREFAELYETVRVDFNPQCEPMDESED